MGVSTAVVPRLFGTRNWFHGRQIFQRLGRGVLVSGWLKCTAFIVYFVIISSAPPQTIRYQIPEIVDPCPRGTQGLPEWPRVECRGDCCLGRQCSLAEVIWRFTFKFWWNNWGEDLKCDSRKKSGRSQIKVKWNRNMWPKQCHYFPSNSQWPRSQCLTALLGKLEGVIDSTFFKKSWKDLNIPFPTNKNKHDLYYLKVIPFSNMIFPGAVC